MFRVFKCMTIKNSKLPKTSFQNLKAASGCSLVISKFERNHGEQQTWSKQIWPIGFFIGFGYYYYKKKNSLFPEVSALSGSRRAQFNFIADVVESTSKAVVFIEIVDHKRLDFFSGVPRMQANGSGFIIKEDGLILTNAHVVMSKRDSAVNVKMPDGTTYAGVVEDIDMQWDLATIRIRPNVPLPVLKLGDTATLRVGEWVAAMGCPLSLSNTITAGVVSSVQRTSRDLKLYGKDMQYIQTDAAITFGNSGGPLINLDGEVIGINAMKLTTGISFAIPIEYAKEFLRKAEDKRKGIIPKGRDGPKRYMGITMLSLTPQIIGDLRARKKSVPNELTHGVFVWKVVVGSPAHNGGLMPGDIITSINGEPVAGASTIYQLMESSVPVLEMEVYRNGMKMKFTVTPESSI
ncbi:HTRA2-related serine protease isoform X1 [Rhodnius prolixus]|uniref:HTRA2-related serine protease isoform X1 n=1 Tax=Rhodnius prolixus TaxID=13249 RepID=UPI003D18E1DA